MNHTTNYSLPQWEANDAVKRSDVNDAMSAIDAALGSCARVMVGRFRGDGNEVQVISLGVTPKAVLVMKDGNKMFVNGLGIYGGMAVTNYGASSLNIIDGGFRAYNNINTSNEYYHYLAIY